MTKILNKCGQIFIFDLRKHSRFKKQNPLRLGISLLKTLKFKCYWDFQYVNTDQDRVITPLQQINHLENKNIQSFKKYIDHQIAECECEKLLDVIMIKKRILHHLCTDQSILICYGLDQFFNEIEIQSLKRIISDLSNYKTILILTEQPTNWKFYEPVLLSELTYTEKLELTHRQIVSDKNLTEKEQLAILKSS